MHQSVNSTITQSHLQKLRKKSFLNCKVNKSMQWFCWCLNIAMDMSVRLSSRIRLIPTENQQVYVLTLPWVCYLKSHFSLCVPCVKSILFPMCALCKVLTFPLVCVMLSPHFYQCVHYVKSSLFLLCVLYVWCVCGLVITTNWCITENTQKLTFILD
jgi:hypothetical protein